VSEFNAILITKDDEYRAQLTVLDDRALPQGNDIDVHVDIAYSTLNYKDALAITGRSPVARRFPLVPGIDFAGRIERSRHAGFSEGDEVVLNGWGVGESYWGGFSQKAGVRGDWLIQRPATFSLKQTMAIGTAGYTAALCVLALERHGLTPASGKILVTGASGGVGSIAILLLAARGYEVIASSGKPHEAEWLTSLGAREIIDRNELSGPGKPLAKERWAGAIDTVGSHTLANVCAATHYGGAVAACGLAQGMDFPATVAPFILRNVALLGVDSVQCPIPLRRKAWHLLEGSLDARALDGLTREIALADVFDASIDLLEGRLKGRVVVNVNA
jgi:acrylyl-CoA reductase (NADPH)